RCCSECLRENRRRFDSWLQRGIPGQDSVQQIRHRPCCIACHRLLLQATVYGSHRIRYSRSNVDRRSAFLTHKKNGRHHDDDARFHQTAARYYLSSSGTLPPFSASLFMTCLCSQIFIDAESLVSPL